MGNNIGRACSAHGVESCLRINFCRKPSRGKSHQAGQLRITKNTCIRETEFGEESLEKTKLAQSKIYLRTFLEPGEGSEPSSSVIGHKFLS